MARRISLVLAALAATTVPGLAAEGSDCRCRYQGKYFDQGALVCIRVDGEARLARCGMFLNNSTWQFLQTGCPSAMMTVPSPGRLASLAGIAALAIVGPPAAMPWPRALRGHTSAKPARAP